MGIGHMRILTAEEMQEWVRSRGQQEPELPREQIWLPTGVTLAKDVIPSPLAKQALDSLKKGT